MFIAVSLFAVYLYRSRKANAWGVKVAAIDRSDSDSALRAT